MALAVLTVQLGLARILQHAQQAEVRVRAAQRGVDGQSDQPVRRTQTTSFKIEVQ